MWQINQGNWCVQLTILSCRNQTVHFSHEKSTHLMLISIVFNGLVFNGFVSFDRLYIRSSAILCSFIRNGVLTLWCTFTSSIKIKISWNWALIKRKNRWCLTWPQVFICFLIGIKSRNERVDPESNTFHSHPGAEMQPRIVFKCIHL